MLPEKCVIISSYLSEKTGENQPRVKQLIISINHFANHKNALPKIELQV